MVAALIEALADKQDHRARLSAAGALCEVGQPAKAAIPILRKAMEEDDEDLRRLAELALKAIEGPKSQPK